MLLTKDGWLIAIISLLIVVITGQVLILVTG